MSIQVIKWYVYMLEKTGKVELFQNILALRTLLEFPLNYILSIF